MSVTGKWRGNILRGAALCAALLAARVDALDPRRPLDLYDLQVWREGLPQHTVQALLQSSDGYLWAGTIEGLVRFDGLAFEVWDRQRVPSVANWRVRALAEGPPGTIWIGTTGGGLLRYRGGVFSHFGRREGLAGDDVTSLRPGRGGALWVGTASGLTRCRGRRCESWGEREGLPNPSVHAILEDEDGSLLVGAESGLFRFDGARFRPEPFGAVGPVQPAVSSLARHGVELLVGTFREGLFRVRGGRGERVLSRPVSDVICDREGSVWVATAPGGLVRLGAASHETLDRARGLPNDTARVLLEDREGDLWIGTAAGLVRLRDQKFGTYVRRHGLAEDNVRVVLEEPSGALWIGTYGGGLARLSNGAVTSFGPAQGFDAAYVRTLALQADGTLAAGTESGLYFVRSGVVTRSTAPEMASRRIDALLARADGSLLVCVDGLGLYELHGGRPERMTLGDVTKTVHVRVMLDEGSEKPGGRLWLGTSDRGLLETDGRRIVRHVTVRDGLPDDAVFALLRDPDGTLWAGTHAGLARLRGDRIDALGAAELPVPTVFQIIDDGRGSFWLTSHRGITRVGRRSLEDVLDHRARRLEARLFGRKDGLGNDQCNGATQPAGIRLHDGRLAIPTLGGVTIVDPGELHPNAVPPIVALTDLLVDGQPAARPFPRAVSWRSRRVEIRYDGLSLRAPDLVTFRFRMEGLDPDWVDAGTRRAAFYASLPPGSYVFRVQAQNGDGVWSDDRAEVPIEMARAPWRRWWAVALYFGAALAAVGGAVRVRERALRARNALLAARVAERTAELAEANRRLEVLSVTDALTGIANRRRFDELFELEWRRASRGDRRLAVVLIDVDRFKAYNDRYGHQAGDDCLRAVAAALQGCLTRGGDVLARYGGEEFVVVLPATSLDEAAAHAERLRAAVAALGREHADVPAGVVTISVGVAALDDRPELARREELLEAADRALYRAKEGGRNRVLLARVS